MFESNSRSFDQLTLQLYFQLQKYCSNNFKMNQLQNSLKIQVRITTCTLQKTAAPISYSFVLVKDNVLSPYTHWKNAEDGIINFNSYLRIQVPHCLENDKCILQMYSILNGHQQCMGQASLRLSPHKCNKVRKYPVKDRGQTVAVVSASLYLFNFDSSLPTQEIKNTENSIQLNQFYSQHKDNNVCFDRQSKEYQDLLKYKNSGNFQIINEVNIEINQNPIKKVNADALLVKLFQGIDKKKQQIMKRQIQLKQKDEYIEHIRMKEQLFQQKQKKIHQLKENTLLLIQTNNQLIKKDTRYDQEYYLMKQQKQNMQQQMAIINSQASLKLMCLQTQLQSTNRKLQNRQNKVRELFNQVQLSSKELNLLRIQNKQKLKIMKNLSHELQVQNRNQNSNDKNEVLSTILSLLAQHFQKENPQTLLSVFQQQHNSEEVKAQNLSIKKYKSLSLCKPNNNNIQTIRPKQKFRHGKRQNQTNIPIPTIIQSILLVANKQNMSKLIL